MKQLLFVLFATSSAVGYAQAPDGFGQIRIGKTYLQIIKDIGLKKVKEESNGKSGFFSPALSNTPILLRYDSEKKVTTSDLYVSVCSNSYVLFLPRYEVGDIDIKDIRLSFYNDTLYFIQVNKPSDKFIDAIKLKYGKGNLVRQIDTVKCSSLYAKNYEVFEQRFTTTWPDPNDELHVWESIQDYRNSKCEQVFTSSFYIIHNKGNRRLLNCQIETRDIIKAKEAKEKKDKLGDF